MDDLLQTGKGVSGLTRLVWLRISPGKPSAESLYHLLERLAFVGTLQLPAASETVHPHRVRQLANRCRRY